MINYFVLMQKDEKDINSPHIFIDDGAAEASCRTLSDQKPIAGKNEESVKFQPAPLDVNHTLNISITNMNHCVVGILERWTDTKRVMNKWFPWINVDIDMPKMFKSNVTTKETRHTLRPELYQVMVTLNPCDMQLYEVMLHRFDTQMLYLETHKQHDLSTLQPSLQSLSLPAVQVLPSPSHPFVFLHVDKCAGTSIRQ